VMGKHGKNVTSELLLGSVTKRVLADCLSDVLIATDEEIFPQRIR
jgi:nucleotide-binding universal stress UspA family protein